MWTSGGLVGESGETTREYTDRTWECGVRSAECGRWGAAIEELSDGRVTRELGATANRRPWWSEAVPRMSPETTDEEGGT